MASTNCNPQVAIVYASVTGNTHALAAMLQSIASDRQLHSDLYRVEDFSIEKLSRYDIVLIGTYTWGSGEVPREMRELYEAFENLGHPKVVTAVFGTGDSFFAEFCGAVDRFRDMLYVHTDLAATLKVELTPQEKDYVRGQRFVEAVIKRNKG